MTAGIGPENLLRAIGAAEYCPNCGHEWPARLGSHGCTFHREYVHNNAIVVSPYESLFKAVDRLTGRLEGDTCRSAQYADLAGEGDPYGDTLRDIDATIGLLKRFRRDMQALSRHAHRWNEDDYCSICGADGRA